jgi:hypothetical protein
MGQGPWSMGSKGRAKSPLVWRSMEGTKALLVRSTGA